MSLNPVGMQSPAQSISWNYSRPNDPGYAETFVGTVIAMQEVQARTFRRDGKPGEAKFWNDGNPVFNMRILFALPDGQLRSWTFAKAGKNQVEAYLNQGRPCIQMQLFDLTGRTNMTSLIGKTLFVGTVPGAYAAGNPRPFNVALAEEGPYQAAVEIPEEYKQDRVLCNDAVSGGQLNYQQPAPQYQAAPPMHGQYYAAPQPIYAQPQQAAYNPVTQQYVQPQQQQMPAPQYQPAQQVQQPMQPPMPQGMDPAIAAAMQQIGATNVQPVPATPYDDSIPF